MKNKPPKFAQRFLSRFTIRENKHSIIGDAEEDYKDVRIEKGVLIAHLWLWLQVFISVPSFLRNNIYWSFTMLKNYFKISLRNLKKHKSYSVINISGLAIGLACCLLILLWIQDEFNYEKFNKNLDEIFNIVNYSLDEPNNKRNSIPVPVIPHLKNNFAEIKYGARFRVSDRRLFSYNGNNTFEENGGFADPELFDIFSFKALINDPKAELKKPNTIILTKSMAERYFGAEDPLGKRIKLENQYDFFVGAIIEDIPKKSSFRFEYLIPFENYCRFENVEKDNWGWYAEIHGFVLLHDNVEQEVFSGKIINELVNNHPRATWKLGLYPFKNLRIFGLNNNGTFKYILIFSTIAFLILLIACINFVNLATAQSVKRAMEIGLRKVIGASKSSIRRQLYSELFVLVTISFILAIILSIIFLPTLNQLSGKTLSFSIINDFSLLMIMFGIALVTAMVSGTYPAFYLSSFSPIKVMKSDSSTGSTNFPLKKILVISQFAISIILLISTIIITKQMSFIKNKELGFDKDHLVYVELLGDLKPKFETVKNELLNHHNIHNVTVASSLPNNAASSAGDLDWEGKPADIKGYMNFIAVEKDYFQTVGIEFIKGEMFKSIPSNRELREFIINEKALERMQIENPIGKSFRMWERAPGRIIGIVKNVHNASLHQEIRPVFYVQFPYFYSYLLLNIRNENVNQTIGHIQEVIKKFNPNYPFEFHFMDENIDIFYQTEKQISKLILYFTSLAIFISCLGLFGLSLFMAEQRIKEIGIRKTLGATVSNIVGLMSKDFLFLVVFSNLISWPAAYLIMNKWLHNFAYKVNLSVWIFLLAGLSALFIALITISFQSIKAATTNPIDSLKYE